MHRVSIVCFWLFLWVPMAWAAGMQPASGASGPQVEDLGALDGPISKTHQVRLSSDGRHVALVLQTATGFRMVHDGQVGSEYDEIADIEMAEMGTGLVYSGRKRNQWFALLNGRAEGPYELVRAAFSQDGKHIVYSATVDKSHYLFVDGKRSPAYSSSAFAAVATHGGNVYSGLYTQANTKAILMINGEVAGTYDGISLLEPNRPLIAERLPAYRVKRGEKWFPVVLGREQAASDLIDVPVYSPNNDHFAFIGIENNEQFVVVDGKREASFEMVFPQSLVVSAGGEACYVAGSKDRGGKKSLIVGGKAVQDFYAVTIGPDGPGEKVPPGMMIVNLDPPTKGERAPGDYHFQVIRYGLAGETFNDVRTPVATEDGKHWAYAAMKDRKWYLVVNGQAQAMNADELSAIGFLADGRLVYRVVKDSTGTVFVGDTPAPGYSRNIRITKDGRNVIWVNKIGPADGGNPAQEVLMVNGRSGPRFSTVLDWKDVKVSSSGRYAAYDVNRGADGESYVLVAGGRTVTERGYDVVFSRVDDRVAYLQQAGDKRQVFIDERLAGECDDVSFLFSPAGKVVFSDDGRHFAFVVRKGQKHAMVVDGVQGPLCDEILVTYFGPRLGADYMVYFGLRDGHLIRVTQPVVPGPDR